MVNHRDDCSVELIDNLMDGEGACLKRDLTKVKPANVDLLSEITVEPGASIGMHSHYGESEVYYILSGSGIYVDMDREIEVCEGDTTICRSGGKHALKNNGDKNLKILAVIVLE